MLIIGKISEESHICFNIREKCALTGKVERLFQSTMKDVLNKAPVCIAMVGKKETFILQTIKFSHVKRKNVISSLIVHTFILQEMTIKDKVLSH